MRLINGFVFAGLVAITGQAQAEADVYLQKTDFISAHVNEKGEKHVVQGQLKPDALAKLNAAAKGELANVHIRIADSHQTLKLKDKLNGNSIEFGPFNNTEAQKISAEINKK